MLLITLILGIVLLPKVTSLQCYECVGTNACTQKTCPSGQSKCGVMSVLSYAGGVKANEVQVKSCTSPAECIQGSVNFGISSTHLTSQCCDSDLCNTNAAPAHKKTAPNGLKCFTCDGEACDGTVSCRGNEDHCISTQFTMGQTTLNLKGCASRMICSQADNPQLKMALGKVFSCCEGNLCNSGRQRSSLSAGLLLLPTLLLPLVMPS